MGATPTLTPKWEVILGLLSKGPSYGMEMVRNSQGLLERRTVYVALHRLIELGLLLSSRRNTPPGELGPPRRVYRLSAKGQRTLAWWREGKALAGQERTAR